MALVGLDLCLLVSVAVFVFLDIILSLGLGWVLPYHATRTGWYPTDERKYDYDKAIEYCPCLGGIFSKDSKNDITFEKSNFKRSLKEQLIDRYSYLVSLTTSASENDLEKKFFVCNGIALDAKTVLTMANCVSNKRGWYNLTIRSRSAYWSQYGDTHAVVGVSPGKTSLFVELKILPEFSQAVVPKFGIKYPSEGKWSYAVKIGWDHQDPSIRFKNKIFDVEEWTTLNSTKSASEICYDSNKYKPLSKFLITSCYQLAGVEVVGDECAKFLGFTNTPTMKGECRAIYLNDYSIAEKEVCRLH